MAKVSFSKVAAAPQGATAATVTTPTTAASAASSAVLDAELVDDPCEPCNSVAVPEKTGSLGFVSDEEESADSSEIITPRINLVQKVGALGDIFNKGEVVLGKTLVLPQPINLLVLGFRKTQFTEAVEGGDLGRLFDTEAEVASVGGTLDYKESKATGKPLFKRLATAMLLLEKHPELDGCSFPLVSPDGKQYAIALWSMKGGNFTHGAQVIKTAGRLGHLRGENGKADYTKAFYGLSTKLLAYKTGNSAYVPVLKVGAVTTPEFRAWVAGGLK